MKVSVIIPVLNDAERIGKCLSSIIDSSYSGLEIIVVDGGSEDGTLERVREFKEEYSDIDLKILVDEGSGPAGARNKGAEEASSDLLYFVDSDIVQEEDTVQRMVKHLQEGQDGKTIVPAYWSKEPVNKGFGPEFRALKLSPLLVDTSGKRDTTVVNTSAFMIRKKHFEQLGGFNEKYKKPGGEDYEFSMRAIENGFQINFFEDTRVLHHYRNVLPSLKAVFYRSFRYGPLLFEKKQFDIGSNADRSEVTNAFLSTSSLVSLLLAPFYPTTTLPLLLLSFLFFSLLLIRNSSFYFGHIRKEKGLIFSLKGIVFDYMLYLAKSLGVFLSFLSLLIPKKGEAT